MSIKKHVEAELHEKAFEDLKSNNQWLLYNFGGWHYREKIKNAGGKIINHSPPTNLYREFDLLNFEKDIHNQLILTGYEVKGYRKEGKNMVFPRVGEGVGQVLTYLLQGVDYGYLILPEPEKEQDLEGWTKLCEQFARQVGLIYYKQDLIYYIARQAEKNPNATRDRKRDILTSASVFSKIDQCSPMPLWVKRRDY